LPVGTSNGIGEGEHGDGPLGKSLRTKNMADNIQAVTDGNFDAEVLTASNTKPVMVDFWAEWCRPCHMLAPTVAEIAHDYEGKLKVMKLNVDEAMNSAGRYNIRGIPTLLVFKNGQVVEQIVGAVPKDQITKALERHIA
jgi:thioredoxin 1